MKKYHIVNYNLGISIWQYEKLADAFNKLLKESDEKHHYSIVECDEEWKPIKDICWSYYKDSQVRIGWMEQPF